MKKLRLLSLVGITLIALAQAGWAAGHGGGGGGGFGGGGFGGGGRGGGGGHFGGGFGGAPHFGGGAISAPHVNFGGAANRGGGVGFGMGRYAPFQSAPPSPVRSTVTGRSVNPSVRATAANNRRSTAPVTAPNRAPMTASARSSSRTVAQRGLNGRTDHIYARHDQSWHQDWDHHRAHFSHNHWWVYDGGAWIGLDDGFYPWDYYPYYAFDYYPYDYYPGYYADVEPYYNNEGVYDSNVPAPDSNVATIQTRLTQLGYYNGPADGIFGPSTRDAVARYQTDRNLPVTGSLSADTLQSLGMPGVASN